MDHALDDLAVRIQCRTADSAIHVVAIDGRSGSGKSTRARSLAQRIGHAVVIEGDDFYAGGVALRSDTPAQRVAECIDWRQQREMLVALRAGRSFFYRAFDWDAFDGSLQATPSCVEPAPVVILEGVYSARPELREWIDLRALVAVNDELRLARLHAREGGIGPWEQQWIDAETWYFEHLAPPTAFDAIISGAEHAH
jgi:uridine kinase